MENAIKWLRASFFIGAVADCIVGFRMLNPGLMGEKEFRYPMGLAASLMFGWTVLLLWGSIKPMERKGILLITIFPVIIGLLTTAIWAGFSGIFPLQKTISLTIGGLLLILLLGFSYIKARIAEKRST